MRRRCLVLFFILLSLASRHAQAQSAGSACSTAGQVISVPNDSRGSLICNGTTYEVWESVLTGPLRHGIGTATPAAMLTITGVGTAARLLLEDTINRDWYLNPNGNLFIGDLMSGDSVTISPAANITLGPSGVITVARQGGIRPTSDASWDNLLIMNSTGTGWVTFDTANYKVGIASSVVQPRRRLDILDTTAPQLRLTYTNNSVYTDMQTTSAGSLYINPSGGSVGINTTSPAAKFVVAPPTSETIAGAATITADACGTVKKITAAGAVTTNTTNTFTSSTSSYDGCCMDVLNAGSSDITLDANAKFKTAGGTDQTLTADDMVRVCSNGTNWYQVSAVTANQ